MAKREGTSTEYEQENRLIKRIFLRQHLNWLRK